jgi:hypothetical protein
VIRLPIAYFLRIGVSRSKSFDGGGGGGGAGGGGGLLVMNSLKDDGLKAFWNAQPDVRPIILAQAEKRVESTLATLSSLNQRLASSSAIMFAGAAVSATLTTNADNLPQLSIGIAAAAALSFAIAGIVGFVGLFSSKRFYPGERPSWWLKSGLTQLTSMNADDANYWLAGHHEEVIDSMGQSVSRRARAFNASLGLGAIGAVLIASSATNSAVTRNDVSFKSSPAIFIVFCDQSAVEVSTRLNSACGRP